MSQSSQEKKTYRCFVCEKNGFRNVQVVLGGKDKNMRTIYLEPDGRTPHQHKLTQAQQQGGAAAATAAMSRQEFQQLTADITEIKEMLQRYQTYYGDLIEFMHKLTITQQQERDQNEQLAEKEYNYDRDKEDGIV